MSDKNKKIVEKIKAKNKNKPKGYWLDTPEEKPLEDADIMPAFSPAGIIRNGVRAVVKQGVKKGVKSIAKEIAKKAPKVAAKETAKKGKMPNPVEYKKNQGPSTYDKMPAWKAKMQRKKAGY